MPGTFILPSVETLACVLLFTISQGLEYIHKSSIGYHGNLTSQNTLIDGHWVLKLTKFGLNTLKEKDEVKRYFIFLEYPLLFDIAVGLSFSLKPVSFKLLSYLIYMNTLMV